MSLKADIEKLTREFEQHVPEHLRQVLVDELERLKTSGIADCSLKAGDRAPSFVLPNLEGTRLSSESLLARGPLVVCFYRGIW